MAEQQVVVDGLETHVEVLGRRHPGRPHPRPRAHGSALEPGPRQLRARLPARSRRPARRRQDARARARGALARALGRRPRRRARSARASSGPSLVGHSLGASIALKIALERPDDVRCARADRRRIRTFRTSRRGCSPRPSGSRRMGLEAWVDEYWSQNPPFSDSLARARPVDARGVPGAAARERPRRLRPPVPSDRGRGEPGRPARRRDAPGARARRRQRRPHAARARSRGSPSELANARVVELPGVGHTLPLEAPEATASCGARVPR